MTLKINYINIGFLLSLSFRVFFLLLLPAGSYGLKGYSHTPGPIPELLVVNQLILGNDTLTLNASNETFFIGKYNCNENNAVHDFPDESTLTLFPNPSNESFEIKSNYKIESIQITDVTGRIVDNEKAGGNSVSINMSSNARGVYFAKVKTFSPIGTARIINKKIIKE